MKEITIPVPDGKRAEWINGVLTLVDEQKVDNRPVTERIKTLADAMEALGQGNPLVEEYIAVRDKLRTDAGDLIAYLKLRIIVAALNEGWKPKFDGDECRYYPWFYIYAKEEYEELDEDEKKKCRVVGRSDGNAGASGGVVCACAAPRITMLRTRAPTTARGLPSELVNSQPTQVGNSSRNGLTLCLSLALARS